MTPLLSLLPPIKTKRLRLRPLRPDDAEAFRTMTDEKAIVDAIDFLSTPFTRADAQKLIEGEGDGRDCFWGVWRVDEGDLIGAVGGHLKGGDEIEIGYWFASRFRGFGFGAEAAAAVVGLLATAYPQRRIVAECRPENKASWRLLEKIGFLPDGGDGRRVGRKRLLFSGSS